ncbi:hypothetical protein HY500_04720 [Candidatus Woesearchaeota archaeon]|nr:hypothetical protein [Candidatus Woesearchaeota archaeon]
MAELIEDKKKKILGKALTEYRIEIDEPAAGVEKYYFWVLSFLQSGPPSGISFTEVHKITDLYTSSETSSYFGMVEQRKGLQQDKVSQYLATIGKMTKDLFQMIRELRIIDERYSYYKDSKKKGEEGEAAEISLKSIWIDMVEGGSKNPTSVFGLAQQVGFVVLPDLFFTVKVDINEENKEDMGRVVHKEVEKLKENGINRKVREVLERKLYQYYLWRTKTEKEVLQRRKFMLKYLKQHYHVMRTYIHWLKPYFKNISRLQMYQNSKNPNIVAGFDTSQIDLELLAKRPAKGDYHPCIRARFTYVAMPQMAYQQEYQRGAIHTGKSIIEIQSYTLTDKDIANYEKLNEEEDLEILGSLTGAMEALGDELKQYLKEAGEVFKEDKKEKDEEEPVKRSGIFKSIFYGFGEMFGIKRDRKKESSEEEKNRLESWRVQYKREDAIRDATGRCYILYDVFKKANRMPTW